MWSREDLNRRKFLKKTDDLEVHNMAVELSENNQDKMGNKPPPKELKKSEKQSQDKQPVDKSKPQKAQNESNIKPETTQADPPRR